MCKLMSINMKFREGKHKDRRGQNCSVENLDSLNKFKR